MTSRLTFVSPAMNHSLRQARFDDGASLDEGGRARAAAVAGALPSAPHAAVSPSVRCRETAAALGLRAAEARQLAPLDAGRWRGRTFDEVGGAEPEAAARWLTDPSSAPHGGESVEAVCARVAHWMETAPAGEGRTLVVAEAEIVRAAVVRALDLPAAAFWRLDVPPLTATELSGRSGRWNLRLGSPLAPPGTPAGGAS